MTMVTEFVAGGELFDRIVDSNYKMTEAETIKYMRQIYQDLQHMNENNIVHLNLKVRKNKKQELNTEFLYSLAGKYNTTSQKSIRTCSCFFSTLVVEAKDEVFLFYQG